MSRQGTGEIICERRDVVVASTPRREEPSTYRMSADEVRAFIRQFEPEPPPVALGAFDDEAEPGEHEAPALEREPPTLLYRRRRPAPRRRTSEPGTLLGLGMRAAADIAPRALPPAPAASSVRSDARAGTIGQTRVPERAADRRSAAARAKLWQNRVRWAAATLGVMLLASVLMLLALRRADATREGDAYASAEASAVAPEVPTKVSEDVAHTVAQDAVGATQQRMEDVRRATSLMMAGDRAGALTAFRALSRAWPGHPAMPALVRALEEQLRACAAQGGAACP